MVTLFNTLIAIGTLFIGVYALVVLILLLMRNSRVEYIAHYASIILRVILVGAMLGSLTYELVFGYAPCLLCWYQRMALFPLALLVVTANIRNNSVLQRQVLWLASIGFVFSLYHNFIDIFPGAGPDVCGTGVSCLLRYVNVFGFVTIPLMSGIVLLSVIVTTLAVRRYPQQSLV